MTPRIAALGAVIGLALLGLGFRAYHLQVRSAATFASQALENQTRADRVPAPRGRFLDRRGRVLAETRRSLDVLLVDPRHAPEDEALLRLARVLGLPTEELARKLPRRRRVGYYLPTVLKEEVGTRTYVRLLEDKIHLPGVVPRELSVRHYPYETLACHLFGRVGRIPSEKSDLYMARGYHPDSFIGTAGLEKRYETRLRGEDGIRTLKVDALGWPLGEASVSDAVRGEDLVLSLDLDVQLGLERALGSQRGSVVVVEPRSGDILGLASSPRFDPNHFNRKVDAEEWKRLESSPEAPLLNRALSTQYQPGSTWKILVALAALEAGVSPDESLQCTGSFQLGPRVARCWKKTGHGWVSLLPALAQSCNVYFYQMGLRAGIDGMVELAAAAGFGKRSGVDVGGEKPGVLPSPAWRRAHGGTVWTRGDTINVAIGQGEVLVTPLQMARLMGALENDGVLMRPRLVRAIRPPAGSEGEEVPLPPEEESRLPVSRDQVGLVLEGLHHVVERGTGRRARVPPHHVYGKTGSAQNPAGNTHAWFVGVMRAPAGPVAVAVLLENAGGGGSRAAPVARAAFQAVLDAGWDVAPEVPPEGPPSSEPRLAASSSLPTTPTSPVVLLEDPDLLSEEIWVDPAQAELASSAAESPFLPPGADVPPAGERERPPAPPPPPPPPEPTRTPAPEPPPSSAPRPPPTRPAAPPPPPPGSPPPDLDALLYR